MARAFLLLVASGAVCSVSVGSATAASGNRALPLPWPPTVLPPTPPLAPATSGVLPLRPQFLRRLSNRERVVIGLDDDGTPNAVRVLQRIVVNRLGDYVFAIPAPVLSVTPGPGTGSPPGQRVNQILWEGFSPGRRVLSAWADLRVGESASSLPARVRVRTEVDGKTLAQGERRTGDLRVTLTVTNATAVTARSYTGDIEPASLDVVLARIRAAMRDDVFAEGMDVVARGPTTPTQVRVAAPIRIEGTLRFAPGTAQIAGSPEVIRVSGILDGLKRARLQIVLRGRAVNASPPKLELRVRTGDIADPVAAGDRLAQTVALELAYARKRQYDQFLASPDLTGPSSTTYVYRTAAPPAAAAPIGGSSSGKDHTLGWILLGLGLAAAVPAAAVVWAHS